MKNTVGDFSQHKEPPHFISGRRNASLRLLIYCNKAIENKVSFLHINRRYSPVDSESMCVRIELTLDRLNWAQMNTIHLL